MSVDLVGRLREQLGAATIAALKEDARHLRGPLGGLVIVAREAVDRIEELTRERDEWKKIADTAQEFCDWFANHDDPIGAIAISYAFSGSDRDKSALYELAERVHADWMAYRTNSMPDRERENYICAARDKAEQEWSDAQ